MAAGININGVDMDLVFKARVSTKRADVGFQIGGVDISNRYEKSASLGDRISSNTGYKAAGVDLQTLFQDINYTPGAPLAATVDNSAPSTSGTGSGPFTTGAVTVTPSGGTPGYSYSWARLSGDATISISSSTVANPTWSASGTAPATKAATWRCTVTDAAAATVTVDVTVTIVFNTAALSVTNNKTAVSGYRNALGTGTATTDTVITTVTGGTPAYTYLWERVSGDTATTATAGSSAATAFSRTAAPVRFFTSTWRCKVTDSLGNIAYSPNVDVALEFDSPV